MLIVKKFCWIDLSFSRQKYNLCNKFLTFKYSSVQSFKAIDMNMVLIVYNFTKN